jgi:ribonuclease E
VEAKVEELALNAAAPSTGPATDAATILKAAPNAGPEGEENEVAVEGEEPRRRRRRGGRNRNRREREGVEGQESAQKARRLQLSWRQPNRAALQRQPRSRSCTSAAAVTEAAPHRWKLPCPAQRSRTSRSSAGCCSTAAPAPVEQVEPPHRPWKPKPRQWWKPPSAGPAPAAAPWWKPPRWWKPPPRC